ncbi:MAG: ATP-binding protein [Colwellia sp.]
MKIIFVAGVHGVGKGTISNILTNKYQLEAFSASSLIKNEKKSKVDINKVVQEPKENQDHLSNAIKKLTTHSSIILLDGHFCLNTADGIFKVLTSTFESLSLDAVFLITEKPSVIFERLLKRDGNSMGVELIEVLQKEEILQAKFITSYLKIPLIISKSGNMKNLEKYLNGL